ncbi:MAG: type transport system ATP-binding protein, partial [Actinomycetota bacterium]|nr:type transport system ATP-binding protein [Actinomycetota bacterium]
MRTTQRVSAVVLLVVSLVLVTAGVLVGAPAEADGPKPLGIKCHEIGGVRFCQGNPGWTGGGRVRSWDGFPLDVDVTLPPTGQGPWPTLVMLHPWSTSKTLFEATKPDGGHSVMMGDQFNNNFFAHHGYLVVNFTSRGMIGSCGAVLGDLVEGNGLGVLHCPSNDFLNFADTRDEIRDAQHLVGRLVDDGLAQPGFAVTGESYGAGETLLHAVLRDRMVLHDGTTVPLLSPKGVPLEVKAAVATAAWSDFVPAALTNGRQIDTVVDQPSTAIQPTGVMRESFLELLYLLGIATGEFASPQQDYGAALPSWLTTFQKGEPYDGVEVDPIWEQVRRYRSPMWIPNVGKPAPMMIMNGWTDDLFPPIQAISMANAEAQRNPDVPVHLRFASIGHPRAQNKAADRNLLATDAIAFIDHFLLQNGTADTVPGPVVRALGFTCPDSAPSTGPFDGDTWSSLATVATTLSSPGAQIVDAGGGQQDLEWATDPSPIVKDWNLPFPGPALPSAIATFAYELLNASKVFPLPGAEACRTMPVGQDPGVAVYDMPSPAAPVTMVGIPTVNATIATRDGEVAAELATKLWDVDEVAGRQTLVTKGIYRLEPNQSGPVTMQLNGSAWTFQPRHHAHLEISGADDNSWRASNNTGFTVEVSGLTLILP